MDVGIWGDGPYDLTSSACLMKKQYLQKGCFRIVIQVDPYNHV
jgi:hypothetical protein